MAPETVDCTWCKKSAPISQLKRCDRCKKVLYCNRDCQANHWPVHKRECRAPNYVFKVELFPGVITNPPVVRNLSAPAEATFEDLHNALQITFGWASCHLYQFLVKDSSQQHNIQNKLAPRYDLLQIVDRDEPEPDINSMLAMMGIKPAPVIPKVEAPRTKIRKILDDPKYAGCRIWYEYDFGDGWMHDMHLIGRSDATGKFECLSGEGHGVAEDCGGSRGWQELLDAYRAESPDKEQLELREWFENRAANADPKGLVNGGDREWDMRMVNQELLGLRHL